MEPKTTASLPNAIISCAGAVGIALLFICFGKSCGKTPTLTVTEPQNHYSTKARTVAIKGTVIPANSTVLVSGDQVIPDKNGNFLDQAQLPIEGDNRITVRAFNGEKTVTTDLTIIRILTDEEKAAEAKAKAAEAAADAAADAEAKAQEAAYSKTRAGKLCAKHPSWSRDDCRHLADHRIWIGMTLEMLKVNRGRPDHATPSNYGNGTSWQWCWSDTPHLASMADVTGSLLPITETHGRKHGLPRYLPSF